MYIIVFERTVDIITGTNWEVFMVTLITGLIFTLTLHKIGAVKDELFWAEMDTTNDSIMWYAVGYGNNEYDIYHDGKRVRYIGEWKTLVEPYIVQMTECKVYPGNKLIFTVAAYNPHDTTYSSERIYRINGHGEIYGVDSLNDIVRNMGTYTGYVHPHGEDWEDTTVLDTIINGHCIGVSGIYDVIDTQFVKASFSFEGYNIHTQRTDTFIETWYVDLIKREVLYKDQYPYLYEGKYGYPVRESDYWVAVRHDSVFISKISTDFTEHYVMALPYHSNQWFVSTYKQYFDVIDLDSSIFVYNLIDGRLLKELTIDSLPLVYNHPTRMSGGFEGNEYYYVSTADNKSFFIYHLPDFQLVNKYEDTTQSILLDGTVIDSGSALFLKVPPTKDSIFVEYKTPEDTPVVVYSCPMGTHSAGGIWQLISYDKYFVMQLTDSTYIFKRE